MIGEVYREERIVRHSGILAASHRLWTGRELYAGAGMGMELARALFEASFVLVSHGTEPDPVLNYGNRAALRLWDVDWATLTSMPSRLTAEAPERAERERLLERVRAHGFIDDYSGVRVTRGGRRFRIERATVWNLVEADGSPCGQAAMFDRWVWL